MEIRQITQNKKQFLVLLLLADEQESMIDLYLERGTMYVLEDNGIKAECVVTDEGNGILELKNLAVSPESQGKGYGRLMRHTSDKGIVLILDSRIVSKGYGAMMLRSLPESYHPETETKTLGQKIEGFLF